MNSLGPKLLRPCSILVVMTLQLLLGNDVSKGYVPPNGFAPNAETAIAVAEAILKPVYGNNQIESERPFKAVLRGNIWFVTGSVPCNNPPVGAMCPGGAAEVRISKRTGQVLFMTHHQ